MDGGEIPAFDIQEDLLRPTVGYNRVLVGYRRPVPQDDVPPGIADEKVAAINLRQEVAAVDQGSRGKDPGHHRV